jgi:hypothetical protein
MNRIQCRACGVHAMIPLEVIVEGNEVFEFTGGTDQESHFYTCHVCGDNWLSIREDDSEGQSRVMFIHQMGITPILKRIAQIDDGLEEDLDYSGRAAFWEYFVGDDEVPRDEWEETLVERRTLLKSICTN